MVLAAESTARTFRTFCVCHHHRDLPIAKFGHDHGAARVGDLRKIREGVRCDAAQKWVHVHEEHIHSLAKRRSLCDLTQYCIT